MEHVAQRDRDGAELQRLSRPHCSALQRFAPSRGVAPVTTAMYQQRHDCRKTLVLRKGHRQMLYKVDQSLRRHEGIAKHKSTQRTGWARRGQLIVIDLLALRRRPQDWTKLRQRRCWLAGNRGRRGKSQLLHPSASVENEHRTAIPSRLGQQSTRKKPLLASSRNISHWSRGFTRATVVIVPSLFDRDAVQRDVVRPKPLRDEVAPVSHA